MSNTNHSSTKPEIPKSLIVGLVCGGALLLVFFVVAWATGLDNGFYGLPPHAELLRSVEHNH